MIAWAHNETSTGVKVDVTRPDGSDGALVLIDATSAAAAMPVDLSECDAYYFAPQKAFGVRRRASGSRVLSPAAIERIAELDGAAMAAGSRRSCRCRSRSRTRARSRRTTRRPSRRCCCSPSRSTGCSTGGGLEFSAGRSSRSSEHLYGWAEASSFASPFVADLAHRSPSVGTIDFSEDVDAAALAATLRANGIVDVEPYRKLGRNQLRVGMFPAVDPSDVEALTACIDWVVENAST